MQRRYRIGVVTAVVLAAGACSKVNGQPPLDRITLPPGFEISVYAKVPNARALALGPGGTVFVGSASRGKVYAIVDRNRDHRADTVYTIASGLAQPLGVAFRDGALYVSAISRILRFDDIEKHLTDPPTPVVIYDKLPKLSHHGGRFLGFGPDGRLYVPVGAPCNVCGDEPNPFALMVRLQPDGSKLEVYSRGIRNSVGFDWHPRTGALWFTDNGRDWLGDDAPPDELNHAPTSGMHFGFPYCHGGAIADPEFGSQRACSEFTPPAQNLDAHVAPLGMRFYTGTLFPPEYRNQIFIAEHGSWNRDRKAGYRVTLVKLDGDRAVSYQPFAQGWLSGEDAWGRPADVLIMPDGALLVSDDHAGLVYRISYRAAVAPR